MNSKDSKKNKISFKSIDKRLKTMEQKIDELPKKSDMEKKFTANLLVSLAFVLVAITIPLIIEIFDYSKEALLWGVIIPYMILIIGFMYVAGKILKRKDR